LWVLIVAAVCGLVTGATVRGVHQFRSCGREDRRVEALAEPQIAAGRLPTWPQAAHSGAG
jgi:hypothetical protein